MFAIKEILDIKEGMITIRLPQNFPSKQAEIIILPVEGPSTTTQQRLQEILLDAPTLTEEELRPFEDVREWMDRWNIKEF